MITETWIQNKNQASQQQIANYTHYYNYRTDTRGGGVSVYVHNNLRHSLNESTYEGGNNFLWIRIENFALDVGVIYNPGDTNFKNFLDVYDSQLQQRKRAIVFGDFNIDLLTKNKTLKLYKQTITQSGHTLLNKINKTFYTRASDTKKSILDHSHQLKNRKFQHGLNKLFYVRP